MGSDRYLPFLPFILDWIQQTLDAHAHERRAVSSFNFPRLPHYFSEGLLIPPASSPPTVRPCRRFRRLGYESLPTSRVNRPEESRTGTPTSFDVPTPQMNPCTSTNLST